MKRLTFLDLAPEQQDHLLDLPFEGRYLVSGPPGTGKTELAVQRAVMLDIAGRDVVFLTFSNVLRQYADTLARHLGFRGTVTTCHKWFKNLWIRHFHREPPRAEDDVGLDWTQMLVQLARSRARLSGEVGALVVNEGQNLPREFYALCSHLTANATVFADDNQRIDEGQSTLGEIERLLGRDTQHRRIIGNHRNTRQIAEFANHFYCGPSDRFPPLPERQGPTPTIRRFRTPDTFADVLATFAKANPGQEIGVVLRHKKKCISLHDELYDRGIRKVQSYVSDSFRFREVDFTRPGIRILSPPSTGGQEFDTLFIPNLELYGGDPSSATLRMQLYSLATLARNELYLSYGTDQEPELTRDVPDSLLTRVGT